jgi:hypothetical protein
MRIRRIVLVGAITLGLAGSTAVAANASSVLPGSEGPSSPPSTCPAPPPGADVGNLRVKDGKIYYNGNRVGTARPGEPVAVRDGKVYVGAAAEALPKPPGAEDLQVRDGKIYRDGKVVGDARPGTPVLVRDDGTVYVGTDVVGSPKPGDANGPVLVRVDPGAGDAGFVCQAVAEAGQN